MKHCKDCEHSIFDEQWGQYKCKLKKHVLYNEELTANCEFYQKNIYAKAKREVK